MGRTNRNNFKFFFWVNIKHNDDDTSPLPEDCDCDAKDRCAEFHDNHDCAHIDSTEKEEQAKDAEEHCKGIHKHHAETSTLIRSCVHANTDR